MLSGLRLATRPSWLRLVKATRPGTVLRTVGTTHFQSNKEAVSHNSDEDDKGFTGASWWPRSVLVGSALVLGTGMLLYSPFSKPSRSEEEKVSEVAVTDVDASKPQSSGVRPVSRVRDPAPLPSHVDYLLIGGGTASFAASRAIRSHHPKASVLVISEEAHTPYMRPPLSKELWYTPQDQMVDEEIGKIRFRQWNGKYRYLNFEPDPFYVDVKKLVEEEQKEKQERSLQAAINVEGAPQHHPGDDQERPVEEQANTNAPTDDSQSSTRREANSLKYGIRGGVAIVKGRKVVKLNADLGVATMQDGAQVAFTKCLLATGGQPKKLPVLDRTEGVASKVSTFRRMDDFLNLRRRIQHYKSVAIIGGGFLGSELACALAHRAKKDNLKLKIVQLFPEKGNLAQVLPAHLSEYTTQKLREEGVEVFTETEIESAFSNSSNNLVLNLNNDRSLEVDHAIVAVGLEANTELADASGLEVDNELGGFKVNAELEARTNIYAAGDVATFFDVRLGKRRVEHHDHAIVSGRLAGENMASDRKKPYVYQSIFWSDLGPDIGFEAIGNTNADLNTVAVFAIDKNTSEITGEVSNDKEEGNKSELTDKNNQYNRGVVFYLDAKERVVGLVLWNLFNKMGVARRIIQEHKKFDDLADLAKHFDLHGDDFSDD